MRSRVTLATIDAAAIESDNVSPLMIDREGMGRSGNVTASINRQSAGGVSDATARRMARRVASKILRRSISCSVAIPTPTARARATITSKSRVRSDAETCLESFTPARRQREGRMTAAATTGPARGPRPASSRPAIRRHPRRRASNSNSSVGPTMRPRDTSIGRAPNSRGRRNTERQLGLRSRNGFCRLFSLTSPSLSFHAGDELPIFDFGKLALLATEIIKFGPANFALAHHFDARHDR